MTGNCGCGGEMISEPTPAGGCSSCGGGAVMEGAVMEGSVEGAVMESPSDVPAEAPAAAPAQDAVPEAPAADASSET